jgi:hypothetical protein
MTSALISAQLYENDDDQKSTPLLASSPASPSSPSTLSGIFRSYNVYSLTFGCVFGTFVYLGTAFIVGKLVQNNQVDKINGNHLPLLLFGLVWTTSLLLASGLLVSMLRALVLLTNRTAASDRIRVGHGWQSMLIVLVCCFILGFELGAGVAWISFLCWRRPASYNALFAVYFILICALTSWALRVENEKLETLFDDDAIAKQDEDGDEEMGENSTGDYYEPMLVV